MCVCVGGMALMVDVHPSRSFSFPLVALGFIFLESFLDESKTSVTSPSRPAPLATCVLSSTNPRARASDSTETEHFHPHRKLSWTALL